MVKYVQAFIGTGIAIDNLQEFLKDEFKAVGAKTILEKSSTTKFMYAKDDFDGEYIYAPNIPAYKKAVFKTKKELQEELFNVVKNFIDSEYELDDIKYLIKDVYGYTYKKS